MKSLIFAASAAALVAATALPSGAALAARPSSENNWPGMTRPALPASATAAKSEPHYVQRIVYSHGGRGRVEWVLVE